ncbi:MAG TPA: phosphatase PAP2 family protein [Phycisphaerae bacterium]|nr:phosphatase PAP2 family protein [Phycisphaerae bacterium]
MALLGTSIARAETPVAPAPAVGPFLTASSVDWKTILPPPVSKDSPEQAAELNLIVAVQKSASPEALAEAKEQIKKMDVNTFADIIGPWFDAKQLPKTEALFHEIEAESKKMVTGPAKKYFGRVRPADSDKRVKGYEAEEECSYPSGHSTRGTMDAYVLGALFPELKDKLIARGQQVGFNRIIVGAHYPSDLVAGRVIGKAIADHLLADAAFQKALAECREEIAAARTHGRGM